MNIVIGLLIAAVFVGFIWLLMFSGFTSFPGGRTSSGSGVSATILTWLFIVVALAFGGYWKIAFVLFVLGGIVIGVAVRISYRRSSRRSN